MYEYAATIVRVHDGDTVRADVDLGFRTWLRDLDLRLYGINAWELSDPRGLAARDALLTLVLGQRVRLTTLPASKVPQAPDKQEKYGRWLAVLTRTMPDGTALNVNDWMVAQGHAVSYNP